MGLAEEMARGVSAVCATCEHHASGLGKGLDGCGDTTCVGPARAGEFPNYKGPIPRERFNQFCLRCMSPTLAFQVVVNGKSSFGLCHRHRRTFEFLKTGDALQSISPLLIPV